MGKDKKVSRWQFLIRAKGRHGTHSPFVYSFIEKVLRHKGHYPNCPNAFRRKDWHLFQACLDYLQPATIFFDSNFKSKDFASDTSRVYKPLHAETIAGIDFSGNKLLLLTTKSAVSLINDISEQLAEQENLNIYILRYPRQIRLSEYNKLITQTRFKMVIDFWDGLLLAHSSRFKEKQFFKVKKRGSVFRL